VLHKRRGPLVAWLANLILLAGVILRLPFWLLLDALNAWRGPAQKGLFRSRFVALQVHLKGAVWPVWVPRTAKTTDISAHPATT
jgi:hypothetical protein